LGSLFGHKEWIGWILHFAIGIFFAMVYMALGNKLIPVESKIARGAIYGIVVFVFSEIILTLINFAGFFHWDLKEEMALMIFGNSIACLIYGSVLGLFFERVGADYLEEAKHIPPVKETRRVPEVHR
jgi:uncharacterized membrane protein YagU involved in acid resistance